FFQAEDGIRDKLVTGVQTCALPISAVGDVEGVPLEAAGVRELDAAGALLPRRAVVVDRERARARVEVLDADEDAADRVAGARGRSEERRVGKEWRAEWAWHQ